MPDHLHLLTDSPKKPSEVLRYIKGIISHRVIDYLKEQGYETSLEKLQQAEQKRGYRYGKAKQIFFRFSAKMFLCKK